MNIASRELVSSLFFASPGKTCHGNASVERTMGALFSDVFRRIGARIGCAILNAGYVDLGVPVLECMSFTCLLHSTRELLTINGALAPSG